MNYLYISKKLNIFSSYLNLLSSISWLSLIFIIGYYHFFILLNPNSPYLYPSLPLKSFSEHIFENLGERIPITSVQETNQYPSTFIQLGGLGLFFSEKISLPLIGQIQAWDAIQPILIFSITVASLNLVLSIVSIFLFFKARSFSLLISSLFSLFIPIYGWWFSLKLHRRIYNLSKSNAEDTVIILPCQWIKLKFKKMADKILLSSRIPL